MDIKKISKDEVKVTVTLSRTYTFTTTIAAIQAELPSAAGFPTDGAEDAADVVFGWLAADGSIERDIWIHDIAGREGELDDDKVEIEETSLA